ncbi:hypothetical protein PG993_000820 [Apiospora rasikravindrae]|uniref:Uncharacterized protein n=1 Tax=Apiospora rasikravindrae TaxID=990691 RepID=A0ABR1UCD1_9PEZI
MENFVPKAGEKVELSAVEETCLGNLHLRVLDADAPLPILGDQYVKLVVAQLQADFEGDATRGPHTEAVETCQGYGAWKE